jgi:hypothetical protein
VLYDCLQHQFWRRRRSKEAVQGEGLFVLRPLWGQG